MPEISREDRVRVLAALLVLRNVLRDIGLAELVAEMDADLKELAARMDGKGTA